MSLALDDLPRDPEWLLRQLQQMAEVVATERSRNIALEIERDTAPTERDALRAEHDAAQAEIEKLRLLIRRLQRGRFGRRSERLDPDQLQLGLENLEQTLAAAEAAQEAASRSVVFLYAEDRKGEHPAAHVAEFEGVLQVDGYSGFKRLLENRLSGTIRLAFCWAHCRRRFHEIHQATGSPLAEEALRRIGELYRIEAKVRGHPAEERRAARQERSKPIVGALHAWPTAQLGRVSGRSTLAGAIRYALRHWTGLGLFLEDGRVELDTDSIERAIRPIASARKNSLFAGSDGGARHRAIVASLVATAKLNGVEPLAWLTDVLERMVSGRTKATELERLLPWNRKAERLAAAVHA